MSASSSPDTPRWSIATRIAFRFTFVYLLLYNLTSLVELLPEEWAMAVWTKHNEVWALIVRPVAEGVFGVAADVLPNGSGDTTFNYVQVFVIACFSALATIVWSFLDRRRPSYPRLYAFLRVYIRFCLAFAMFAYGVVKVIPLQFAPPTLDRLLQKIGDASPMGLLWTFMGASVAYNVFTGFGEILGGLLLTARRTTLLGALITAGVMSNVVALNFSYDVPVKLFSSHLLAMALFLIAPDARRFANVFLLNRTAEPAPLRPRSIALRVLRTCAVLAYLGWSLHQAYEIRAGFPKIDAAPLYGVWDVEAMKIDGVERPPLLTDAARWRRVVFSSYRLMTVHRMDEKPTRYMMKNDEKRRTMTLTRGDGRTKIVLAYARPAAAQLVIRGTFDGKNIEAVLRRDAVPDFALTNRGFHWINEYPYNR